MQVPENILAILACRTLFNAPPTRVMAGYRAATPLETRNECLAEHGVNPALIDYEKRRKSRQIDPMPCLELFLVLAQKTKTPEKHVVIQRLARFATLFVVDEGAFDHDNAQPQDG